MEARHHQLVCSGLSSMLNDAKYSDFEIRSADEIRFPCHKVIMAAVSPFFEKMLDIEMKVSI